MTSGTRDCAGRAQMFLTANFAFAVEQMNGMGGRLSAAASNRYEIYRSASRLIKQRKISVQIALFLNDLLHQIRERHTPPADRAPQQIRRRAVRLLPLEIV